MTLNKGRASTQCKKIVQARSLGGSRHALLIIRSNSGRRISRSQFSADFPQLCCEIGKRFFQFLNLSVFF
jgi:hypothetical protein